MPTPSRMAVARTLLAVFGDERRVPDDWDRDLSPEDAALAQALLGHALRRWGRLQAWFEARLKQPKRGAPLGSRVAAALGLAQLAWLPGVSTHAAVNESVDLAGDPRLGFPPHKGLVNAVLRRAAQDREALGRELEDLDSALDRPPFARRALEAALTPRQAMPRLAELWSRLQRIPEPTFRALRPEGVPEDLVPDPEIPGALRLKPGGVFPRTWLSSGAGMVQDRSSQALMGFQWPTSPRRILDVCAAPGGKTTALAHRWPEAELTALEVDPRRAARLRENLTQRGVRAEVVTASAVEWLRQTPNAFDLILLDAPCSGSGTFQKHPELPWIGETIDLPRLVRLQRALLEAALSRVAPGGLLVYAVCSWFPEEGLGHLETLGDRADWERAPVWPAAFGLSPTPSSVFLPDPLIWEGEGFQGFALRRVQ